MIFPELRSAITGFLVSLLFLGGTLAQAASSAAEPADPGIVMPVRSCGSLVDVDLASVGGTGSRVVSARVAGEEGKQTCSVAGVLKENIGFQLTLPLQGWTQRLMQLGCGGLCGRIGLQVGAAQGCVPVKDGAFALASTDMGHQDQDGTFGQDPEKRIDFAHRGVHLTALASKSLIQAFYGQAPRYAYFNGCSDGGREALIEAQRYPSDFNGIIAGAAALNFQVQNGFYHAWMARANTGADGKAILLASRLPLIHKAVLSQCDELDGQKDGLIANPLACHFDPKSLSCGPSQSGDSCLSTAEVETVRRFYQGPRDAATGQALVQGSVQPGSELAWAGVFVPSTAAEPIFSAQIAQQALSNVVYEHNPPAGFSLADLKFDGAEFDRLRDMHPLYDATNPDLSAFAAAGGKLIIWHGWADPHISPLNSLAYHKAVQAKLGKARSETFERLYLLPGVHHCGGGEGPSGIDLLTPMLNWVEGGLAPGEIQVTAAQIDPASRGFGAPMGPPSGKTGESASAKPLPMAIPPKEATAAHVDSSQRSRMIKPWSGNVLLPNWLGSDFYN